LPNKTDNAITEHKRLKKHKSLTKSSRRDVSENFHDLSLAAET